MATPAQWLSQRLAEAEADEREAESAYREAKDRADELRVALKWLRRAPSADVDDDSNEEREDLSQTDAAALVLEEAGHSLALKDIVDKIVKKGLYTQEKAKLNKSLRGTLSRMVNDGDTFWRPKRGVYSLKKWQANGDGGEDNEPDIFSTEKENTPATTSDAGANSTGAEAPKEN